MPLVVHYSPPFGGRDGGFDPVKELAEDEAVRAGGGVGVHALQVGPVGVHEEGPVGAENPEIVLVLFPEPEGADAGESPGLAFPRRDLPRQLLPVQGVQIMELHQDQISAEVPFFRHVAFFEEGEQNAENHGEKNDQEERNRSHGLEEGAKKHPLSGGLNGLYHVVGGNLRSFRHERLSFRVGGPEENLFRAVPVLYQEKNASGRIYCSQYCWVLRPRGAGKERPSPEIPRRGPLVTEGGRAT